LGEPLTPGALFGLAAIVSGLWFATRQPETAETTSTP
jgi:hypothetical protein